mmetsp:Transcript_49171/g.111523  ORF Transcript_49171/g.111523 Transcript_49171/m.111523 type:complete len:235 (-) Transcript_49171:51-755(-)
MASPTRSKSGGLSLTWPGQFAGSTRSLCLSRHTANPPETRAQAQPGSRSPASLGCHTGPPPVWRQPLASPAAGAGPSTAHPPLPPWQGHDSRPASSQTCEGASFLASYGRPRRPSQPTAPRPMAEGTVAARCGRQGHPEGRRRWGRAPAPSAPRRRSAGPNSQRPWQPHARHPPPPSVPKPVDHQQIRRLRGASAQRRTKSQQHPLLARPGLPPRPLMPQPESPPGCQLPQPRP